MENLNKFENNYIFNINIIRKMFLILPYDIIITIFENIYDSYLIHIENNYDNNNEITNYDLYLASLFGTFKQINKIYNKEFSKDYYWKHIVRYIGKNSKHNYMKKYIQSKILSYYYEMYYYYKKELSYQKLKLECIMTNLDLINKEKNKKNIFGSYINDGIYVLMKGLWNIKDNNIYFMKYITPMNCVYKWENYANKRCIEDCNQLIINYTDNINYYNMQYKNIIDVLNRTI